MPYSGNVLETLGPGAAEGWMTAATACRTCGTEPREGARFCDGCGSPIALATERAEFKQVTVLFADVVHSMDIAAAVGAERLREIMAELVNRCAAVVQRFGGTVDKFTGDGLMAVFGAPVALEDHAIRPVWRRWTFRGKSRSWRPRWKPRRHSAAGADGTQLRSGDRG